MAKEKKITLKHFLNKKINPQISRIGGKKLELYPVYTQIIYNRKTTTVALSWNPLPGALLSEKEFNDYFIQREDLEILGFILFKEKLIKSAIKYEQKILSGEFHLKGFGKRLKLYEGSTICDIFTAELNDLFIPYLEDKLTVSEYKKIFSSKYKDGGLLIFQQPIWDVYGDLKKYYNDLPIVISPSDKIKIISLLQFFHFESILNSNTNGYRELTLIDWLDNTDVKQEYDDFLYKKIVIGDSFMVGDDFQGDLYRSDFLSLMLEDFLFDSNDFNQYMSYQIETVNKFLKEHQ